MTARLDDKTPASMATADDLIGRDSLLRNLQAHEDIGMMAHDLKATEATLRSERAHAGIFQAKPWRHSDGGALMSTV